MASASADPLPGPDGLDDDQREAVELLLRRLADDEFVLAERYTEWQVRAPTLESDISIANVAQDELGHARLWYDLLMELGHDEPDLIWEREPAEWRHSTLVELPFPEGDWADAVLRGYLYDVAEDLRLDALAESSYRPIAARVGKIREEEAYHREHAESWLERLAESGEGRERLQAALDRLFPHALTLFEPGAAPRPSSGDGPRAADPGLEARIDELGLRTRSLPETGEDWLETVVPVLHSLGLETPVDDTDEVTADLLPPVRGRDGEHTDHWPTLYEEFTRTYRELGRSEATRIMEASTDPVDADDVE